LDHSTFAGHFARRSQSSEILYVKRAQRRRNSLPNPNDSFFHAWAKQRDPKLTANKQSGSAHC
jgi:hypothetical protein